MTIRTRVRHRATSSRSRWAVALRGLRRATARFEARRRYGSIEAYLEEIVRQCVEISTPSNEISHSMFSAADPLASNDHRRPVGRPPAGESKHPDTQLSTTFNQSAPGETEDS